MKIQTLDDIPSVRSYLKRVGAEARSLRSAVVKERTGAYFKDVAVIKFEKDGKVECRQEDYLPTEQEQEKIFADFKTYEFPQLKKIPTLLNLHEELKAITMDNIFILRDPDGMINMLQVRKEGKEGKYYVPWTYFDDECWRKMEPEGLLPLFNLDCIKDNTTAFIHEGAKAARAVQDMIEAKTAPMKEKMSNHPWGKELSGAVHLGWIGGAPSPHRTDWSILKKLGIKLAYIVSDNDKAGIEAVQDISQRLRITAFHLQFTNEFPASFDLADPFPENMFKENEGKKRYVGPAFRACLHPATWATDKFKPEKGKEIVLLRDHFKDMWAYVEEADVFICKPMPNIVRPEPILNKMLSSFSHTSETSKLILKAYNGRQAKLCYRPDKKGMIITNGDTASINLHTPTLVKNEEGSPEPFLNYLRYMFPNEEEELEVERWCATLVARPDLRMEYGLLLVSEATGIGKSTLGAKILAPLVGINNVGVPRETDIVENHFNDWVANKRLVIVHEIYSGHSWKAYHSLKSLITDREISVNQKYQRPYIVDNWCHILAASNSMKALKMEEDDRRWFYPEINEERWSREKFGTFLNWLDSGGLGMIKTWAERFGNYVMPGERAPMTERKREMIDGSRSEAQSEAAVLGEALVNFPKPMAWAMKDVVATIRNSVQGKVFDSDLEIRKTMKEVGAKVFEKRLRVAGRMQYIIMNENLLKLAKDDEEIVKAHLGKPGDVIEGSM